jgi:two-component system, NarL family, response regulator DevR
MPAVSVLLLVDHDVVRRGLTVLLEADGDIRVVAATGSTQEAEERVAALHPDVAVVDLSRGGGVAACRELRSRSSRTAPLLLSSFDDEEALLAAYVAGAAGYVLKRLRPGDLVHAVRRAGTGHSLLDPAATAPLLDRARRRREAVRGMPFGERERALLGLLVAGRTNAQIAGALHVPEATVRHDVTALLAELGVTPGPASVPGTI